MGTMENKLDIFHNIHLSGGGENNSSGKTNNKIMKTSNNASKKCIKLQPTQRIYHNNNTGRWLSTFMARWHPAHDNMFCVGSMDRPRAIDIFTSNHSNPDSDSTDEFMVQSVSGDALTAVASRCCFHPSMNQLILVGGSSSGRVNVVR